MTRNVTSIQLNEPYRTRRIRFLELWSTPPFRIKVYGIAYDAPTPDFSLIKAAKQIAQQHLTPIPSDQHYGVGFLGVHQGKTGNFVFIDWWSAENELNHHVYTSPSHAPSDLQYALPSGPIACVWDLALINHERQAWIDCVLNNPRDPDLDAYLQRHLSADV